MILERADVDWRIVASNPPETVPHHLPRILRYLLIGYIVCLPVQFEATSFLRVAPSDIFLALYLVIGLPYIGFVRRAWSIGHAGLVAIFVIGLAVGLEDAGTVTSYALLNKGLGLFILMITFAVFTSAVRDMSLLKAFLRMYLYTVIVNTMVALAAYILWERFAIDVPYVNFQHSRLSGLLVDPNAFGGLVAVAASIHLITYFGGAPLIGGWRGAAAALVLVSGLLLTFSRSSWIGFSLGLLAALVFCPKIAARITLAAVLVTVPLALLLAGSDMTETIRLAQRPDQIQARVDQFNLAYPLVAENPVFGIGLGTFQTRYNVVIHNTLAWMATEFGLVGLGVFVIFFLGFLGKGVAAYKPSQPEDRPVILGLMCGHLSMLGVSMGIEALYQRHWWLVMAFLSAAYAITRGDNSPRLLRGQ